MNDDEYRGMGRSAGRSRRNRTGEGAARRAPERERLGVDPPGRAERVKWADEEESRSWVLTQRGEKVLLIANAVTLILFYVVLVALVCAWWGLL